jgi:NAD(P)-dependent dehydrogenase (short-subunit alcohol dehydrogenase family)
MEGQFYRTAKTDKHAPTNMANAALNMMMRTNAPYFVKDGIHMNAVDTGWITDEDPAVHAARKAEAGFSPPLDIIDGARLRPLATSRPACQCRALAQSSHLHRRHPSRTPTTGPGEATHGRVCRFHRTGQ